LWRKYEKHNEYQKLLEPPTEQEEASEQRQMDVIYGQRNKRCSHINMYQK
jgi:hypothetical protein